jgi:flavin reductase (DIM6/NTAB) family NADH-FMN oxidoreductase RutF
MKSTRLYIKPNLRIRYRTEESPKSKQTKNAGINLMGESYIEKMWVNFREKKRKPREFKR